MCRTFAQNCRNIELLSLNGCTKITDRFVPFVFQMFCNPDHFLMAAIVLCSTCSSLSKFCPKLKHLDLASCTSITNLSLKALRFSQQNPSSHQHLLKKSLIYFSFPFSSSFLVIPPLSEGCHSLEQLNISWCDQVTKDGIQALVRSCPGLKGLFLKGCTQVLLIKPFPEFTLVRSRCVAVALCEETVNLH